MPKIEKKQAVVSQIKESLNNAVSVVLVDARGINVEADTQLRKKLRQANVVYKVYKNTMIKLAIQGTPFEDLKEFLEGPTSIAIAYEDATSAARIISKEMKEVSQLEFKGAIIDGTLYDASAVNAIANIPSREELLSKLLGSFKSPMASFARVVKAIAEKAA